MVGHGVEPAHDKDDFGAERETFLGDGVGEGGSREHSSDDGKGIAVEGRTERGVDQEQCSRCGVSVSVVRTGMKRVAQRVRYFFWAGPLSGGRGSANAVAASAGRALELLAIAGVTWTPRGILRSRMDGWRRRR